MSVVGIDFGASKCMISVGLLPQADPSGERPTSPSPLSIPKIVINKSSSDRTPAIISFRGKHRFVGDEAYSQLVSNSQNTVYLLKRILGKRMDDERFVQEDLPFLRYRLKPSPTTGTTTVEVDFCDEQKTLSSQQLTAFLLKKLASLATGLGGASEPVQYVISVPQSFDVDQRNALLDAASIAGLGNVQIIDDALANTCRYSVRHNPELTPESEPLHVAIVDVGQSYSKVCVASFQKDKFTILASEAEKCGTLDFDYCLFNHFAQLFLTKHKVDARTNKKAQAKLYHECERARKILSTINEASINIESFMDDVDVSAKITNTEFESICAPVFDKIRSLCKRVLERAQQQQQQQQQPFTLNKVEVAGGGTLMPTVQKLITEVFGLPLSFTLEGTTSVAIGAALVGMNNAAPEGQKIAITESPESAAAANQQGGQQRLSVDEIQQAKQVEEEMEKMDQLLMRTSEKRNELESFIYHFRSQLDGVLSSVLKSPQEKEDIQRLLTEAEDWLYDSENRSETNPEEFSAKLETLQNIINTTYPHIPEHLDKLAKEQQQRDAEAAAAAEQQVKERREPRTNAERLRFAQERRQQGNTLFKENDLVNAINRYVMAIQYLGDMYNPSDKEKEEMDAIKVPCYSNLAMCHIKMKRWTHAVDSCKRVLEIDPKNVKALFRQGQAYNELNEWDKARAALKQAEEVATAAGSAMAAELANIKKEQAKLEKKIADYKSKEKKAFAKMFQ